VVILPQLWAFIKFRKADAPWAPMLAQCKAALHAHYPAEQIARTPAGNGHSSSSARTPVARTPLSRTRGDHSNSINILMNADSPVPMSVVKPMRSLNPHASAFVMPH
jgi:hypothetical protein